MIAEAFVDTNVLIYAAAGAHEFPDKHKRAWDIIGLGQYGISAQVLAEFYVNALKQPKIPLSPDEAATWIANLRTVPVVPIDGGLVTEAIACGRRYKINYWDAALVIAAERLEAMTLYTEDLNHGQKYGSVTAINPFKEH